MGDRGRHLADSVVLRTRHDLRYTPWVYFNLSSGKDKQADDSSPLDEFPAGTALHSHSSV